MKTLLSAVVAATLALVVVEAGAEQGPGERQVALRIESTSLADALDAWAQQSGYQIFVQWGATKDLTARTLKGTFTAKEALEQLLEGTQLTYVWINDKAVSIRKKTPQTVPAALQRTGLEEQPSSAVVKFSGDAQAQAGSRETRSSSDARTAGEGVRVGDADIDELEEVFVTGTHIRGTLPAGAKLIVLDRQSLAESGYSTVLDVLKTLPQNFAGGVTEDNVPDASVGNLNYGSSINLRGLGADSTLVLVNGQRQAAGGFSGSFVDVSSIAVSAIERIEILPDGASAIYGSDAVGGVVNIILRKDFQGAETHVQMGTLGGDADDIRASQVLGTAWSGGNAIFGYQYARREALPRLARDYTASDDLRRFGGTDFRSIASNPGNILDPLTFQPVLAIPSGQNGTDLEQSDFIPIGADGSGANRHSLSDRGDLLPEQKLHSAFLSVTQRVADAVELTLDARYAQRSTKVRRSGLDTIGLLGGGLLVGPDNPFFPDPFGDGTQVFVTYNFVDDTGPVTEETETNTFAGSLSGAFDIASGWRATLSGTYAREASDDRMRNVVSPRMLDEALGNFPGIDDPTTSYNPLVDGFFNPFADGSNSSSAALQAIRSTATEESRSLQTSGNVLAEGPVFALPSGDLRLAVGASYREEKLNTTFDFTVPMSRNVGSAFAEFAIPLRAARTPGKAGRIDLSLAGRYEDYSDSGQTFDPRIGITWATTDALALRASWGTSFRAPRLVDSLDEPGIGTNLAVVFPLLDPQSSSPDGTSLTLLRAGGNSQLKPETAITWSVGLDFTPVDQSDFALSLAYFNVDYQDRISQGGPPGDPFSVLLQESTWSPIIQRNPSQAELQAICSGPLFLDLGFGACLESDVIVDFRVRNLAAIKVDGVDAGLRTGLNTRVGAFHFDLNASYVLGFKRAVIDTSPALDIVDTLGNPQRLRMRGALSWEDGPLRAFLVANHAGAYVNDANPAQKTRIGSHTTLDAGATWQAARGLQIGVNVVNAFDRMPPFVNVQYYGYDTANADLYGRILSATVTKMW